MKTKETIIQHDHNHDGLDRRGFLGCMAWAGTGMLWTVSGGLLGSTFLPSRAGAADMAKGSFSIVQGDMLLDKIRWNHWTSLSLRLVIGCGFMVHGWAKWDRGPEKFGKLLHHIGVPLPGFTAWVVTLLELFGGMAILAGILVTLVSIPLVMSMLVAMFTVHWKHGFSSINTIGLTENGPAFGPPGYEINLIYIAGLLVLALSHPTPLSVDWWLVRRRAQRAAGKASNSQPERCSSPQVEAETARGNSRLRKPVDQGAEWRDACNLQKSQPKQVPTAVLTRKAAWTIEPK